MTNITATTQSVDEPIWFGPSDQPLFGWLTVPIGKQARGGVLLAPPIGKEAFAGRHALRALALSLTARGFVVLRFDYQGTGDSFGEFNDPARDRAWLDSVLQASRLLRSLGVEDVSAVGMRLGATLVGLAASSNDLRFAAMVLWDPCESGRTYLRELNALEALRREDFVVGLTGDVETSEFVFSEESATDLRNLDLSKAPAGRMADRLLVLSRSDRAISERLRRRLEDENVEWDVTTEQGAMLDVEYYATTLPEKAVERISSWLSTSDSPFLPVTYPGASRSASEMTSLGSSLVKEQSVLFGSRRIFGITTEPVGAAHGPWIILINSIGDDHTGRARNWTEFARRWAGVGLRCVRFDVTGYGETARPDEIRNRIFFDSLWLEEVLDVAQTVSPDDPSNTVFIGLCSAAFLAAEGALRLRAQAACVINPPVGIDLLHTAAELDRSQRKSMRRIATRLKDFVVQHQWMAATLAQSTQFVLPSKYADDLLSAVVENGSELLVLASSEDISPRSNSPYLRSIDVRRLGKSKRYEVEFVEGLDHGAHNAVGRARSMEMINDFVLRHFGGVRKDA